MADPNSGKLLDLPGELRNLVYELVLKESEPIEVKARKERTETTYRITSRRIFNCPMPGLVNSCRKLRIEASPIFYAVNNFCFLVVKESPLGSKQNQPILFGNMTPYLTTLTKFEVGFSLWALRIELGHSTVNEMWRQSHLRSNDPVTGRVMLQFGPIKQELEKINRTRGASPHFTIDEIEWILQRLIV